MLTLQVDVSFEAQGYNLGAIFLLVARRVANG